MVLGFRVGNWGEGTFHQYRLHLYHHVGLSLPDSLLSATADERKHIHYPRMRLDPPVIPYGHLGSFGILSTQKYTLNLQPSSLHSVSRECRNDTLQSPR